MFWTSQKSISEKSYFIGQIDFPDISDPEGERNIEQKENQKNAAKSIG